MEPTASHVLVERARQCDSAAIAVLFDRYRDRLRMALRKRLGDRYRRALLDSEDAVQDGILAALSCIDRFEYRGPGSFLAWLLRVAEREVLMRLRAQCAKARARGLEVDAALVEPADGEASPSEVAAGRETEERIQACLDRIGGREREVIVLRRYLDLDTEEIRIEMRLPTTGAVRALLSRAQARLARMLDQESA